MKRILIITLLWTVFFPAYADKSENCEFDADEADNPNFIESIKNCEKKTIRLYDPAGGILGGKKAVELYDEGTVVDPSGISERPIVAPGTLNHHPGTRYVGRQFYSVRTDDKFEQTVMFAMQKLHGQMAQHCAAGWKKEGEWSEPVAHREGEYYLHYQFICDDQR